MAKQIIALAGPSAPAPKTVNDLTAKLKKMGKDFGVAGLGGDPALGMEGLPAPERVIDPQRASRVAFVLLAEKNDPEAVKPIAQQIQGLKQSYPDCEAGFQLYQQGYLFMQSVGDWQLVLGGSHRLARRKVLGGLTVVLRRKDLPEEERRSLALDLGQMQALIGRQIQDVQAAKELTGADAQEVSAALGELQAEEHLVDVMRRVAIGADVGEGELDDAAATYERYTSEDGDLRGTVR